MNQPRRENSNDPPDRAFLDHLPVPIWEEDLSSVKRHLDKLKERGVTNFPEYFDKHPEIAAQCSTLVRITAINDAALAMYKADRKEILRYGLSPIFKEESDVAFLKQLIAVAEGKTTFEGDVTTYTLAGDAKHVVLKWSVLPEQTETYSRVFTVAFDITDRIEQELSRHQSEQQKQQAIRLESLAELSGRLAHDFNNSLLAILGFSDLLLNQLPEDSSEKDMVQQIDDAAQRAAELTSQLMAYSGKTEPTMIPLDLTELIENIKPRLKERKTGKVILKYNTTTDLPPIEGDQAQINQTISNLVDNAGEAIGDKVGIVTISTGTIKCDARRIKRAYASERLTSGTYVLLEVSDTGCGMDKEQTDRVFEPFFSTKSKERGFGMSLVLGIMRGHNGAIEVHSEPDEGTSFRLLFPVSKKKPSEEAEKEALADEKWKAHGTILVIDDEAFVRKVLTAMLQTIGFKVLTAHDGITGVDAYRKNSKDVVAVILDVVMPGMSSEETFREIRALNKEAAIVLSSGYSEKEASKRFSIPGIAGFIHKPYRRKELEASLRRILSP
jgi:two-component system cell cycle sensor histidine kinase/response regulator CckA